MCPDVTLCSGQLSEGRRLFFPFPRCGSFCPDTSQVTQPINGGLFHSWTLLPQASCPNPREEPPVSGEFG